MNLREKIIDKIKTIGMVDDLNQKLYDCYDDFCKDSEMSLQSYKMYCRKIKMQYLDSGYLPFDDKTEGELLLQHNNSLIKSNQKNSDKNRLLNKEIREENRKENVLEELTSNLISHLKEVNNFNRSIVKSHDFSSDNLFGIVHLTDLHCNELIDTINNKYDFNVMAKRLYLLASKVKTYFKSIGIKNILIAMTGDLLKADRRLDEVMNAACNRTKAALLCVKILSDFIIDLNSDFNIKIASVVGNESRVNEELCFSENIASDNYDFMIDKMLEITFKDCKSIEVIKGLYSEKYIKIGNFGLLLTHGTTFGGNVEKAVYSKMAKYSQEGKTIDYVLFGHIHSAYVSDMFSRGASLTGGNGYSDNGLNLLSRASQNLIIVNTVTKERDAIKVDLQGVNSDSKQYEIIKYLEEYAPINLNATVRVTIENII